MQEIQDWDVKCPYGPCSAEPGRFCTTEKREGGRMVTGPVARDIHDVRRIAARYYRQGLRDAVAAMQTALAEVEPQHAVIDEILLGK